MELEGSEYAVPAQLSLDNELVIMDNELIQSGQYKEGGAVVASVIETRTVNIT